MSYKKQFGEFIKRIRLDQKITLRAFCRQNGYAPGNLSKVERGILAPPASKEKLADHARALNIKEGSDNWQRFFDLAALCKGELPADILSDNEVAKKLPLFFRTLRGDKVPKEQLEEMIELIRYGGSTKEEFEAMVKEVERDRAGEVGS